MDVRRRGRSLGRREEAQVVLAIGVDTHKASIAACAIDELGAADLGAYLHRQPPRGTRSSSAGPAACQSPRRIGLEGAAGFGAGLARLLIDAGEDAREVPAILTHRERRHAGQPGQCVRADALAIARVVAREARLPTALGTAPCTAT